MSKPHDAEHRSALPATLPFALPIASSKDSALSQATDTPRENSGTKTTPHRAPSSRRTAGRRQLARLRDGLSERDWEVIRAVGAHRYLTTRQVELFCFVGHASPASRARTARRVLRRMAEDGVLHPLERRLGGVRAGSASYVWQLGLVGYRLLREDGASKRTHEPSPRFLGHCLAIADAHLAVLEAQRAGTLLSVAVETEPACWRPYTGTGGERLMLQPDLYVTTTQSRFVDRWFVEIDLGTESLNTLLRKCAQYEAYRATGIEQSTTGVFPLVVWQLPAPERLDRLAHAVARSSKLLPELFRFVLPGGLTALVTGDAS